MPTGWDWDLPLLTGYGWVLDDDQHSLRLYYGAADTSICVASADLKALIDYLHRHCICVCEHAVGDRCKISGSEPFDISDSEFSS